MSLTAQVASSEPAVKPEGANLRQHPRILCVDGGVLRLAIRPEFRGRQAVLLDISTGGIGFILKDRVEPGSALVFELKGEPGMDGIGRMARVRHCRPHPTPPEAPWLPKTPVFSKILRTLLRMEEPKPEGHSWFVGCEFDRPLSEAEMKQFLEHMQAAFA